MRSISRPVIQRQDVKQEPFFKPRAKHEESIQRRGVAARRPPTRPTVRRPVRQPTRAGTGADSGPKTPPAEAPYYQRYVPPDRFDTSLHAGRWRHSRKQHINQLKWEYEKPTATLERGGTAPNFFSDEATKTYHSVDQAGTIKFDYTPRKYHVLDHIEYQVSKINTEQDALKVLMRHSHNFSAINYWMNPRRTPMYPALINPKVGYFVYYPNDFDPGAVAQTSVLMSALRKRIIRVKALQRSKFLETLSEAEDYALEGKHRKPGECEFKEVARKTGNRYTARHNLFAVHVARELGYPYTPHELRVKTPEGVSYDYDVYNPINKKEVLEVKTRHEWASDDRISYSPHIPWFDNRAMEMDFQRLRGLYVSDRCKLKYRYAFDNCEVVKGMRIQWANIPPIIYMNFPGEPRVPC